MEGDDARDDHREDMQEAGLCLKLSTLVDAETDRYYPPRRPPPPPPPPPTTEPSLTLALPGASAGDRVAGSKACSTSTGATARSDPPRRYHPKIKTENEAGRRDVVDEEEEEEEEDGGGAARKKLRLSKEQSALLEDKFKEHSTLNPRQKQALARQLKLRPRQVEVWFQNRRARTKLKRTEVEYELLKKCCESLKEENRRLQRELHEFRYSIKTSGLEPPPPPPLLYAPPAAAVTAFRMCPLCKKVAAAAGGSGDDGDDESGSSSVVASPKPGFFNPFAHSSYASFH